MNVTIKPASVDDAERLAEISSITFAETFSEQNSAEDMQNYLDEKLNPEVLSKELQNPESEFYFAEVNDEVAGYLKINSGNAQTENQESSSLEVERIYVKQAFQGMKIGQLLFDKALERASEKSVEFIWLGVWEHNQKAIKFYEKNGFEVFGKHDFVLGTDIQTDLMMRKKL